MSAPIPEALQNVRRAGDPLGDEVFRPTDVIYIEERETHIPSWYVPHVDPENITVKRRGQPLKSMGREFKVSDVAPERRWAIGVDGEVMDQRDFESSLDLIREEFFVKVKNQTPPEGLRKKHKDRADRYVKFTVDPQNPRAPLIAIGYRDAEHDAAGNVAEQLWDPASDEYVDRMQSILKAHRNPKLRKMLTRRELQDVEEYMAREGIAIEDAEDNGGLVAKLEELNGMLRDGDITAEVHSKRVALLTGAEVQPETIPTPPEDPSKNKKGKEARSQ